MADQNTIELYDILGKLNSPIQHIGGIEATKELLSMLNLGKNDTVLDVACGSGNTACDIAREYGCLVKGIDASEIMIANAKKRAIKRNIEELVEFRIGDIFDLPFEDETFNAAIFESVLNVLTGNRNHALKEVVRVVRPGGVIGANEFVVFPTAPQELLNQYVDVAPFLGDPFTPQELKKLFEKSMLQEIVLRENPSSNITSRMVLRDSIKLMGVWGLLSYVIRMFYYTLRYPKLRQYSKYSRLVLRNKKTRDFFGYVFIAGKKP
ncbi:MAG: class I SAM-dependent methyltransferase [Candidatus Hodarchaeales archaeon]|jgi:ubiquinone/menaquinone biosynthesis C-methylase UbiE